jgi:hypothetical protein
LVLELVLEMEMESEWVLGQEWELALGQESE